MSHVTDIILITAIGDGALKDEEYPNADKLSAYLDQYHCRNLERVDGHAGGDKVMQCNVFLAAINYLDIERFVAYFKSINWEWPESVQLLIKDENDDAFEVYTPDVY